MNMSEERDGLTIKEFETWHVFDTGGAGPCLRVRLRQGVEVRDWRNGPILCVALQEAARQGWHEFDREPGAAPSERTILHLWREVGPDDRVGRQRGVFREA
jgi:hypothetical protein